MLKTLSILYTSYKNYTAYIADILWVNIVLVVRVIVIWILYAYLYDNFSSNWEISGYTIAEVTYAVIIAQVIANAAPRIADEIQLDVKSGKISVYLLNPISYIKYKFLEFFPIFLYNMIIWLIIWLVLWYLIVWTFPVTLWWIFFWIITLILSMIAFFFWYMSIWLLAFYTEDMESFRLIYGKANMILWGNLIPIPFLPGIIQNIAYLTPFPYFWYTTWLLFAKFDFLLFCKYTIIQILWILISLTCCCIVYNHAKNKLTINGG
jgi:ABC-2 type transport system permease protein